MYYSLKHDIISDDLEFCMRKPLLWIDTPYILLPGSILYHLNG